MFRRKSLKLSMTKPKPPTKAEILEDLETFSVDHIRIEETRRRLDDNTLTHLKKTDTLIASIESPSKNNNESQEWWNSFEKFLGDIDKLETYQKHFVAKKSNLVKLDDTIALMADDIQTKITNSLQKASDEIVECENDLK